MEIYEHVLRQYVHILFEKDRIGERWANYADDIDDEDLTPFQKKRQAEYKARYEILEAQLDSKTRLLKEWARLRYPDLTRFMEKYG